MRSRLLIAVLVSIALGAAAPRAAAQTTVTLRPSARLAEDAQEVRLRDVADLAGDEADTLAGVIVMARPEVSAAGWIKLDLAALRSALDAQGVNWGRVSLRGGQCTLRLSAPAAARQIADRPARGLPEPSPIDFTGEPTLRTAVALQLAAHYGVQPAHLRLAFDPSESALLDTPILSRQVTVAPAGLPTSPRLPVTINVYDADRLIITRTIQTEARILTQVATASTTLDRGREIQADQINTAESWIAPTAQPPARASEIIGSVATGRILAGETIRSADLAAPFACKRGDTVHIHCLSGSVIVKVQARALGSARDGEYVELRIDGAEAPVTARMSGRGRAVLIAGGEPATPIKDSKR